MPRCLEPPTARLKAHGKEGRIRMIRWIAAAGFVVAVATSEQAIPPAPIPQRDGMITKVRFGRGPGRTLVAGWQDPPPVIPAESSAGAIESASARGGELRHKAVPGFLALTGGRWSR